MGEPAQWVKPRPGKRESLGSDSQLSCKKSGVLGSGDGDLWSLLASLASRIEMGKN